MILIYFLWEIFKDILGIFLELLRIVGCILYNILVVIYSIPTLVILLPIVFVNMILAIFSYCIDLPTGHQEEVTSYIKKVRWFWIHEPFVVAFRWMWDHMSSYGSRKWSRAKQKLEKNEGPDSSGNLLRPSQYTEEQELLRGSRK